MATKKEKAPAQVIKEHGEVRCGGMTWRVALVVVEAGTKATCAEAAAYLAEWAKVTHDRFIVKREEVADDTSREEIEHCIGQVYMLVHRLRAASSIKSLTERLVEATTDATPLVKPRPRRRAKAKRASNPVDVPEARRAV